MLVTVLIAGLIVAAALGLFVLLRRHAGAPAHGRPVARHSRHRQVEVPRQPAAPRHARPLQSAERAA